MTKTYACIFAVWLPRSHVIQGEAQHVRNILYRGAQSLQSYAVNASSLYKEMQVRIVQSIRRDREEAENARCNTYIYI